jgi:hypothetical protein
MPAAYAEEPARAGNSLADTVWEKREEDQSPGGGGTGFSVHQFQNANKPLTLINFCKYFQSPLIVFPKAVRAQPPCPIAAQCAWGIHARFAA